MAFSSNIYNYVEFAEENLIQNVSQIIIIGCRSKIPMLHFPQNTYFNTVKQHLGKSIIHIEVEGVEYTYRLTHIFDVDQLMISSKIIIDEVIAFVRRGHSLKNPQCTCSVQLGRYRILDLGICIDNRQKSNEPCPILNVTNYISNLLIQNEIRVLDIMTTEINKQSIYSLLKQSPDLHQDSLGFWMMSNPEIINCQSTLYKFIQKNPTGVDVDEAKIQYPYLFRDLHALSSTNKILILKTPHRIFLSSVSQRKCDEDICKLWRQN